MTRRELVGLAYVDEKGPLGIACLSHTIVHVYIPSDLVIYVTIPQRQRGSTHRSMYVRQILLSSCLKILKLSQNKSLILIQLTEPLP